MVLEKKTAVKEKIATLELEMEKDKVRILQLKKVLEDLEKNQQIFLLDFRVNYQTMYPQLF